MSGQVKWAISFLAGGLLLWVGWHYYGVLLALHVILCLILIGVILLQSGEAADLAGAFGGSGSQTAFGPRGATTFLSRATTWCAIMFMFTSLEMTLHVSTAAGAGSILEQFSRPPATAPATPKPAAPAGAVPAQPAPSSAAPGQTPAPASPIQSPKPGPSAPAQSAPSAPAAPGRSGAPAK